MSITLFEVLTLVGAITAFSVGIFQYRKAQSWKMSEFYYTLFTNLKRDDNYKRATTMLDWISTEIQVLGDEIQGEKSFDYTNDLFRSALRIHTELKQNESFSDEEALIRIIFDDFFDQMTLIGQFLEKGILDMNDVRSHFGYYLEILAGKRPAAKGKKETDCVNKYLEFYGYGTVIRLINSV